MEHNKDPTKDQQGPNRRRVSFTVPTKESIIEYDILNTSNSRITSASESEMEFTTDIAFLREGKLFESSTPELNKDINKIFSEEPLEDVSDGIGIVEQFKKNLLGRKDSLDYFIESTPKLSMGTLPIEDNLEKDAKKKKNSKADFIHEKQPENNESAQIEDLVNTMDLRKIINISEKPNVDILEFLSSKMDIRFLDGSVGSHLRRQTLSKTRNTVDPSLTDFHIYGLKEQIEFYGEFASFLEKKNESLQNQIQEAIKEVNTTDFDKEMLTRIRNESRVKSQAEWYSLRKTREYELSKKLQENIAHLKSVSSSLQSDLDKLIFTHEDKKNKVEEHTESIKRIDEIIKQNDPKEVMEVELVKKKLQEHEKLLESTLESERRLKKQVEERRIEEDMLDRELKNTRERIERIKKSISTRNVTESDLEKLCKNVELFENILNFKPVKLDYNSFMFDIFKTPVVFEIDENFKVKDVLILHNETTNPFFLLVKWFYTPGICFSGAFKDVIRKFCFADALKKAVNMISEKIKTECFFVQSKLFLRFFSDNDSYDFYINQRFEMFEKENQLSNLLDDPCKLYEIVCERFEIS